jgi:undecaprenyl-phosphate 4-deoxy-4-formamido-L-arabinose transferase
MLTISIVIPVYRGEKSIGALTDTLIASLSNTYKLEILLVCDFSPDNSEAVGITLFKKYPDIVKFFSLAKNVGEHNAVMAGLNKSTGDWVVIMDDDFQNPVSEVVKLIDYAKNSNYDVVYSYYDEKRHSLFRNLGSWINDKFANVMLKKPRNLYLSSFKIMNRFLVNEIIKYTSPYPYIDGIILNTTGSIGKLKLEHQARRNGKSGYTLKKLISLWLNMFTNFSVLPLRISALLGFICALFGFIIGIEVVFEKFFSPSLPPGYSLILIMFSVFTGIQLVAIGMVGEYLGRMFLSQNKKPQFTIRKAFVKNETEKNDTTPT